MTPEATELTPESVKGAYHLGIPERGQHLVELAYGDIKGKNVIAVAPCKRCPPTVYSYLKKESDILNTSIFTTSGMYLIQYNSNSFIVVQPDAILGKKAWEKFSHTNIYSKNEVTSKSFSRKKIEQFAMKISNRAMGQDLGKMQHKTGTYYLAIPVVHIGNAESQYSIELLNENNKEINITPCPKCFIHNYQHLQEESSIIGVDVYHDGSGDYLFDIDEGILVHVFSNASGLGKVEWGEKNRFNVFSNNQTYIRYLLTNAGRQSLIDNRLKKYFSATKAKFDNRIEDALKGNLETTEQSSD